jgi:rod shape-determining protein MreC
LKRTHGLVGWLIALPALVILGFILARLGQLQPIEGVLFRLLAPAQAQLGALGHNLEDIAQTARDLRDLRQRNQQLTELANQLLVENVRLKEVEAENQTLRRLADFVESSSGRSFKAAEVRARVVGREPNDLLQYIVIGAGSEDGIAAGMPVVTERGLVGRVVRVFSHAARVQLIIDADSSVNALVQRSRATGMVKGQVGGRLVLDYVQQGETLVEVGDLLLTSGLGGGYPRQIVIGQVTALTRKDYEMFQQAEVKPTVDFDRLEIVLVITNFTPLSAGAEDVGPTPASEPARPRP